MEIGYHHVWFQPELVSRVDEDICAGFLGFYNAHIVSESTSLYNKLMPSFVYWQIGKKTTNGQKIPAFLKLSGYLNAGESKYVAILYEHGKPFYVPDATATDSRQVACGSNKDNVKCFFEGNVDGRGFRDGTGTSVDATGWNDALVPHLQNKLIIDMSTAQVSFDRPIEVYVPIRTDKGWTTSGDQNNLVVNALFK